uniref:Uncharacterized protein n=1 Tax=Anguilla anguilla TaxID=7936 RepID=A0A0E9XW12_ANGAN
MGNNEWGYVSHVVPLSAIVSPE